MVEVVELDVKYRMTVGETFARAQRDALKEVIIIGRGVDDETILIFSDMENCEAYWSLHKAARIVFDA